MRIAFIAMLLFAVQGAYAQQTRISLNVKQATLKQTLKIIESKSEYTFFYNDSEVDVNRKITLKANNERLDMILSKILPDNKWIVENKKIIILSKTENTTSKPQDTPQKARKVSGVVTDSKGEVLIGVNVSVQGSGSGIITDIDGKYSLNVPEGQPMQFSYMGYITQHIKTGGKSVVNVVMQEDSKVLDEVVVVGYGVQKKANLSGAVAGISSEVLNDRPVGSIGQALQGAVANLNITMSSGQANQSPNFNIRGTTSLNGGDPLVVVDGVVSSTGDLNNMNSADIESLSVLKDAASSAIYGSRAAFGVILVTTKKGKGEKVNVNYNNNFTFRKLTRMPDIVTDPATVVDMKNIFSYPWYNLYDENEIAYAKRRSADSSVSPYYLNPDGTWSYFGNTDWFDEAYKNSGFSMNHSIDVSGSTKRMGYYFSANYYYQGGMLKHGNDLYNRYNLRSKLDFKVTDWWSISNNTSYSTNDYDEPNYLGSDFYWAVCRTNPLYTMYNPDGTRTETGADLIGRMEEGGRYTSLRSTLNTLFTTKIDLIKDVWTVNGSFALSRYEARYDTESLPIAYHNGPDLPMLYINDVSSAKQENSHSDNVTFDVYTNFTKTFAKKHFVNAMIGFNQEEYTYRNSTASRKELISTSLPSIGLATGDMSVSESRSSYALRGMFYRLNYIFNNKYIIETNGRYDGTSRFPKDDRFVFNPSASVAWVMSEEKFFKPLTNVVDHLKLRASYGSLGNQDVSTYAYIATMGSGKTSVILDGKQPVYVSAPGLVSSSLTWETVTTKDIGIDLNLFNNRLTASFDYYIRDTKDMLTKGATLPGVLGTSEPNENAADLQTKGWDLTLGWRDQFRLAGKNLSYNLNFTLSDSRSKITRFSNDTGTLDDYYAGYEIGTIWGLHTLGYFTSKEDVKNHADQTTVTAYPGTFGLEAGDLKFEDRNGDKKIDWGKWTVDDHGDFYKIGNSRPHYNFGLQANAEWNHFDLSLFLQGVGKKDYYPGPSDLFFWGVYSQPWTNVTKGNMDYWTEENPNAYFPRRKAYMAERSYRELGAAQTKYLQNAAYLRVKNLTIGYTLPETWLSAAKISRLRIFFSGENLCEWSGLHKYYKVDPEGLGGQMYPFQRSYSFGLNVSF